jgi:hypothetical protein
VVEVGHHEQSEGVTEKKVQVGLLDDLEEMETVVLVGIAVMV